MATNIGKVEAASKVIDSLYDPEGLEPEIAAVSVALHRLYNAMHRQIGTIP